MVFSPFKPLPPESRGRELFAWEFVPSTSRKVAVYGLMILLAGLVAAVFFLPRFVPGLEKFVGVVGQYAVLLILAPLLNYLWKLQKPRVYTLYAEGVVVQIREGKTKLSRGDFAPWSVFDRCELLDNGVKLIPRSFLVRPVKLLAKGADRFSAYNVARERISETRALRFSARTRKPEQTRMLPW